MSNLFNIALGIHIFFGGIALVIAPLAMVTVKGGLWHRRWGKIYFWSMAGIALSATLLCWLRSGLFLFLIAIFSFYLALTGYRVLRRKQPETKAQALDWCAAIAMVLAGIGLLVLGAFGENGSPRWVRMIFGTIGLLLGVIDIGIFLRPTLKKRAWFYAHMTRFLSAYVATVTAFSVVNFQFLPYFWRWLWPTILGTAGITIWRRYYARKFAATAAPVPAMATKQ
ncbi:MAG TPA: hypothetical protein VFB72_01165 [Verrucomicrobiae bacterium]|nr:hypothetical protein [Verrucomicrobiae bacterium]